MKTKLYNDLYIADPWPAAYIGSANALIVSDLHLGIEGYLEDEGIFLPRGVSRATSEIVFRAVEDYDPDVLVINGDVKHSFGLLKSAEWRELKEFFGLLKDKYGLEVYVVRGNHDNYLGVVLDKFGFKFFERLDLNNYTIIHGHEDIDLDELGETVIIGHEHPSIVIRDEAGGKYKYKCFLWGEFEGINVLVLPPVSEISSGTNYNDYELVEPMSPILKKLDIGKFIPYAIIVGEGVYKFPPLNILRNIL